MPLLPPPLFWRFDSSCPKPRRGASVACWFDDCCPVWLDLGCLPPCCCWKEVSRLLARFMWDFKAACWCGSLFLAAILSLHGECSGGGSYQVTCSVWWAGERADGWSSQLSLSHLFSTCFWFLSNNLNASAILTSEFHFLRALPLNTREEVRWD